MANPTVFPGDISTPGTVSAGTILSTSPFLTDAMVLLNLGSGAAIDARKVKMQKVHTYVNSESATTAVSEQRTVHIGYGQTGNVIAFWAAAVVANVGAATVTLDLWKNGSTILTSVITLNNSQTARQVVTATIASAPYVVNDYFEVKVVATAGGGTIAKGVAAIVVFREDPV